MPARIRSLIRAALREPLLHFALLGALLFGLHAAVQRRRGALSSPAEAQPSRTITLTDAQLVGLRADFRQSWKRDPTAEQLGDLVEESIADEILFREGSARGLMRDDAVVRQRVIEKMRVLARPSAPIAPTRPELERWFAAYPHRFREAPRVAFEQIYFDSKRRAARGESADASAASALAALNAVADAGTGAVVGDDFVLSRRWQPTPEPQVVNVFGEAFAARVMAAPMGVWFGPVSSEYGVHLVRVTSRSPERMPSFEQAENYVRADFSLVQARAISEVERTFLPRYRLELQGPQLQRLAHTPALDPLLRVAR